MSAARVLVVDDSSVTRALLARTLTRAGFEVLEARDGVEGAAVALAERPSVVVTDLEMPTMDGYQLLRLLKSDPATEHVPVLIVTSHGEAPSRYWGLETGADAYLTKDHEPEELVAAVRRLLPGEPPAVATTEATPRGALDVLARVARHLDANLMQATIVKTLLERGLAATDLNDACRITLDIISQVADAHLLGVAIAEPEIASLYLSLAQPLSLRTVERSASALLDAVDITPGATVEAVVVGQRDGGADIGLDDLVSLPLPLRGASGVFAILPKDAAQFATMSRQLVEAITGHIALVLDNARLAQRLHELSTLDGLTRLLNHLSVHERLTEELERGRRYDHAVSIIMVDIDHFKKINDHHGHLAGDAALRGAALAMRRCMRAADAIGRYGGEEFLVVLPETDLEAARRAAERLRRAVADAPVPQAQGPSIPISASFGVASRAELGEVHTADALLAIADARLYEAKAAGRNCVRP